MIGKSVGRLKVISYSHSSNKQRYYLCECICKNTFTTSGSNLKRGITKSCGCLRHELLIKRNRNNCFARKLSDGQENQSSTTKDKVS